MAVWSRMLMRCARNSLSESGSTRKNGWNSNSTPNFSETAWYWVMTRGIFWEMSIFFIAIAYISSADAT